MRAAGPVRGRIIREMRFARTAARYPDRSMASTRFAPDSGVELENVSDNPRTIPITDTRSPCDIYPTVAPRYHGQGPPFPSARKSRVDRTRTERSGRRSDRRRSSSAPIEMRSRTGRRRCETNILIGFCGLGMGSPSKYTSDNIRALANVSRPSPRTVKGSGRCAHWFEGQLPTQRRFGGESQCPSCRVC